MAGRTARRAPEERAFVRGLGDERQGEGVTDRTRWRRFRHDGRARRSRHRLLVGVPLLLVALLVTYVAATFAQVWWTARHDGARPADAIVVLGAAQYDGQPSGALQGRLDHAYDLWERHLVTTIIVTGGKQPGDRTTEGLTGFTYLRNKGVPEQSLLVEVGSRSTFEALSASRLILEQHGLRTALLVSDPYHNLRLTGIAGELGLHADVSPTSAHSDSRALIRETAAVAIGRVVGYGRLSRL